MNVKFNDISRQYLSLQKEIDKAISTTMEGGSFIAGPEVASFEKEFAEFLGNVCCISCGNGTDAIEILLQAIEIKPGDEVIIPSHSWVSTAGAVVNSGAIPVFVDTLPFQYSMDPAGIEKAITARTKAIIPVHLFGIPAEMDPICELARKHNLFVLEDCAQSHGALYKGNKTGTIGHAATFSFYPTKNLGAYGDAGAIITNNPSLAEKVRMICQYGQKERHHHLLHGRNSRMDTLQAAILSVKLKHLNKWNAIRREHAWLYKNLLNELPLILPHVPSHSQAVYHLFVIQTEERERLVKYLTSKGIATAVHYPSILPVLPIYQNYNKENYPVSYNYQPKILSLPMYPELTEDELSYIAENIHAFWKTHR